MTKHLERVVNREDWIESMREYMVRFLRGAHGSAFTAQHFAIVAYENNFAAAPDERAWGAVFSRCKRLGIIKQLRTADGLPATVRNVRGHRRSPLWIAA